MSSLRKQVNKMIEELSQLESVKEVTLKHNKQLTDDIANMTSENQVSVTLVGGSVGAVLFLIVPAENCSVVINYSL